MDKIYEFEKCRIRVCLSKGLIRIYSDKGLWRYLDGEPAPKTMELVKTIKADYKNEFGNSIKISNSSLMVEIWAHVYSDYIGLLLQRRLKFVWIQKLLQKGIERAEIIDCGEKELDTNRWVWDFLSHFNSIISIFLPGNIGKSNLKG